MTLALKTADNLLLRTLMYGALDENKPSTGDRTISVWRKQDLYINSPYMLQEYLKIRAEVEKYECAVALEKAILMKEVNVSDCFIPATESNRSTAQDSY